MDQPCIKLLNALICKYGKCGDVEDARAVFDNMQVRDVVSWNSILTAYSENIDGKSSKGKEPIELFWQMQQESLQPDVVTLIAVLGSCANAALLPDGISIHAYMIEHGFESSIVAGNALVNMYGKCRSLDDAFVVFARLPKKTEVCWNALITACSEQMQASKAFQVLQEIVDQGVMPNNITFLSMLGACAQPEALAVGKAIHREISHSKFKSLVYISNALINMYGKCGDLEDAQSVFDTMSEQKNLVSWSTLIAAYCENGKGEGALELFGKMQHANVQPNGIVFLDVLTACCHAQLLKEATFFFTTMVNQNHIRPTLKHYNCMVDLLGRVGQLAQAEDMINEMPCPPDSQIWMTLLGACRVHKDAKRAKRITMHVLHLMPQNVPTYVQLPLSMGRWHDVDKARKAMTQSV